MLVKKNIFKKFVSVLAVIVVSVTFSFSCVSEPKLAVLLKLDSRPANPAVGPDEAIYFTMHPFDNPRYKLMKLVGSVAEPYPSPEISESFSAAIGISVEKNGTLWVLDMGSAEKSPRLFGWDTKMNVLKEVYEIPKEVTVSNSFLQDFVVDEKNQKIFIADMSRSGMIDESKPAIIVVDLLKKESRRVLEGHAFVQVEQGSVMKAEGKEMKFTDAEGTQYPLQLGLNPIAIDEQNEWVYFAALSPGNLYRVPAKILGDDTKTEEEILSEVKVFGTKPSSDGMVADGKGRVFVTNVDEDAISIVDKSGTKIFIKNEQLKWTDGLAIAPNGDLVATVNQLNRVPSFNGGKNGEMKPFLVVRISE